MHFFIIMSKFKYLIFKKKEKQTKSFIVFHKIIHTTKEKFKKKKFDQAKPKKKTSLFPCSIISFKNSKIN